MLKFLIFSPVFLSIATAASRTHLRPKKLSWVALGSPKNGIGGTDNQFIGHPGDTVPKALFKTPFHKEEVLAYRLDHMNKAGVPLTKRFTFQGKEGSFQKYAPHDGDLSTLEGQDIPSVFDQFQYIIFLHLRLKNTDGHAENILYKRSGTAIHLIPIDHEKSMSILEWNMYGNEILEVQWSLSMMSAVLDTPLTAQAKEYVAQLSMEQDAPILKDVGYTATDIEAYAARLELLQSLVSSATTLNDVRKGLKQNEKTVTKIRDDAEDAKWAAIEAQEVEEAATKNYAKT